MTDPASQTTDDYVAMPEAHYRSLVRRAEAGKAVALHAEEFLDRLEKRWPEVNDMDDCREALLAAISEMRLLP